MDIVTVLMIGVGGLTTAVVVLWGYAVSLWKKTELRFDLLAAANNKALIDMQNLHRAEIAALVARLDAAEDGRRTDVERYSKEVSILAERSIKAHHESSQAIRSIVREVNRIPCQQVALKPLSEEGT